MICRGFRNAEFGAKKDTKMAIFRILLQGSVTNQVYMKGFSTPDLLVDEKVLNSTFFILLLLVILSFSSYNLFVFYLFLNPDLLLLYF